jgi:Cu-Zn family superoxide dismutase
MSGIRWTAIGLTIGLIGCGAPEAPDNITPPPPGEATTNTMGAGAAPARAVATLRTAQGESAGTATATAGEGGIMLSLRVQGLTPGMRGVHVHTTGRCDPPGFESAGGHWNPAEAQHGMENPQGQHAGDMPNLTVNANGEGTLEYTLSGGAMDGLFDADGAAMVIHASADDQKTDPSGNSGDRVACGVFTPG